MSREISTALSEREKGVLLGLVMGQSNVTIGVALHLSPKTVDTYRGRIMIKLGVVNRAELMAKMLGQLRCAHCGALALEGSYSLPPGL